MQVMEDFCRRSVFIIVFLKQPFLSFRIYRVGGIFFIPVIAGSFFSVLTANSPSANDSASLQRALQVYLQLSSVNVCHSFRDSTKSTESHLHE